MATSVEVTNLIAPIVGVFKKAGEEWEEFFGSGLQDYLYSQTNKYYFVNTFIHRNEKVRFDEIYYPINASYRALRTNFSSLEDILDEYKNITIIGSAGSGKTTLIKYIFLQCIKLKHRIPILIELRNLNEYQGDFDKLIQDKIIKTGAKPSESIFKRTLKNGKFLFLLDGYDEVFSTKKQEINRQIELFIDTYSENRFILTTRPGSGIEGFARFSDFIVNQLDNEDVANFINKIVKNKERNTRINQIVSDPKNDNYIEFLRNPLLLSMFIMAFENHPEIPGKKSAFYRNVFDTLYSKHDGVTKNSFPREKLTKLQREDFESILSLFSYITLTEGQYTFTLEYITDVLQKIKTSFDYNFSINDIIYDLHTSISILILDGFEYSFPHRSMQEYFAALFVSKLNSNKKEKAYKNLSKILQDASNDFSYTLWDLCYELDESSFISNFLIPNLEKLLNIISVNEDKLMIEFFLHLIEPKILNITDVEDYKNYAMYRTSNFNTTLLDYCLPNHYEKIWIFPAKPGFMEKLNLIKYGYTTENNVTIPSIDTDLQTDESHRLLIEHGFVTLIIELRSQIVQKIEHWKTYIERQDGNIDDLLGV